VDEHRKNLEVAEENKMEASKTFDAATAGLLDAVESDAQLMKQQQETLSSMSANPGDVADLAGYARAKGKQQQGRVAIRHPHTAQAVGEWSQTHDDLELQIDGCSSASTVTIQKSLVHIMLSPSPSLSAHLSDNPELEELEEAESLSRTLTLPLSHAINPTESTWLLDGSSITVNLIKHDASIAWDRLCPGDKDVADFRDYDAVARGMEGEEGAGEGGAGGGRWKEGTVTATIADNHTLKVSFKVRGDTLDTWRDYVVLVNEGLPDPDSFLQVSGAKRGEAERSKAERSEHIFCKIGVAARSVFAARSVSPLDRRRRHPLARTSFASSARSPPLDRHRRHPLALARFRRLRFLRSLPPARSAPSPALAPPGSLLPPHSRPPAHPHQRAVREL
jgi:hypothetical protein